MDQRSDAAALIRSNLKLTGLSAQSRVVQGDSLGFLQTCGEQFDVIFLDPPYHATEGYYQNIGEDGFTEADHIRLRDALLSMEGKFLLSYNDDAFIRGLYDAPGIQIEPVTRLNNIRQRYDPNCQFSELLIANYDMAERAHATTQINLFDFQKGEFDETYVF